VKFPCIITVFDQTSFQSSKTPPLTQLIRKFLSNNVEDSHAS